MTYWLRGKVNDQECIENDLNSAIKLDEEINGKNSTQYIGLYVFRGCQIFDLIEKTHQNRNRHIVNKCKEIISDFNHNEYIENIISDSNHNKHTEIAQYVLPEIALCYFYLGDYENCDKYCHHISTPDEKSKEKLKNGLLHALTHYYLKMDDFQKKIDELNIDELKMEDKTLEFADKVWMVEKDPQENDYHVVCMDYEAYQQMKNNNSVLSTNADNLTAENDLSNSNNSINNENPDNADNLADTGNSVGSGDSANPGNLVDLTNQMDSVIPADSGINPDSIFDAIHQNYRNSSQTETQNQPSNNLNNPVQVSPQNVSPDEKQKELNNDSTGTIR